MGSCNRQLGGLMGRESDVAEDGMKKERERDCVWLRLGMWWGPVIGKESE